MDSSVPTGHNRQRPRSSTTMARPAPTSIISSSPTTSTAMKRGGGGGTPPPPPQRRVDPAAVAVMDNVFRTPLDDIIDAQRRQQQHAMSSSFDSSLRPLTGAARGENGPSSPVGGQDGGGSPQQQQQQQQPGKEPNSSSNTSDNKQQQQKTKSAVLNDHKVALKSVLDEVSGLKGVVNGLEMTVAQLREEKMMLQQQLQQSRETAESLQGDLVESRVRCEELEGIIQRSNVEHAAKCTDLERCRREREQKMSDQIERLTSQLESSQQAVSSARPLPWQKLADTPGHPAQVLRECVLREETLEHIMLNKGLPTFDASEPLKKLLVVTQHPSSARGSSRRHNPEQQQTMFVDAAGNEINSEDVALWRRAAQRIYTVLSERRSFLGTKDDAGPEDFMLRTRHMMVGELVFLHSQLRRCTQLVASCARQDQTFHLGGSGRSGGGLTGAGTAGVVSTELELLSGLLADMEATCERTRSLCFTSVDSLLHPALQ